LVELVITGLTTLAVGSFVVGKVYGARVEAKAIAEALKVKATVDAEYEKVVGRIRADVTAALARIRKFL
jgi:hypothetical protein